MAVALCPACFHGLRRSLEQSLRVLVICSVLFIGVPLRAETIPDQTGDAPLISPTNRVLRLNGVDQFAKVDSGINLSNISFTIEFWAQRNRTGQTDYAIGQGALPELNNYLHVGFRENNKFTFAFWANDLDTPHSYIDSAWHHWACTYDRASGTRKIYLDGALVSSDKSSRAYQGAGPFYIGRSLMGLFCGAINEVRVWKVALDESMIQKWMNQTITPSHPAFGQLQGYWPMNEGKGTMLLDVSGRNNLGIVVSSTDLVWTDPQSADSSFKLAHQYGFTHWRTEDGLPHDMVQAILQTDDGYLWIGTQKGLARFDGVRFKKVEEVAEIKNASLTALCEDREKSIWIGTERDGLFRFRQEHMERYTVKSGMPSDNVRTIYLSKAGEIWIGTGAGLSRFSSGKFTHYSVSDGLAGRIVRVICEDQAGKFWIATSDGLNQFRNGKFTRLMEGGGDIICRTICAGNNGVAWTGGQHGLTEWKRDKVTAFAFFNKLTGLADNFISALLDDHKGNLWIGTYGGLNLMSENNVAEMRDSQSLGQINAICEDREKNIWVGTKDGLVQLKKNPIVSLTKQNGLTHDNVMSVMEDSQGFVWAATWGGGLNQIRNGKVSAPFGSKLGTELFLSLCEDHQTNIWAGTDYQRGLYRVKDGQACLYGESAGINDSAIRVIYEDHRTNLWIGTSRSLILFRNDRTETRFTQAEGLAGSPVRAICEDRTGNLWIGTQNGLSRYQDGRFTNFTKKDGISSDTISALFADKDGNLWIGTFGGGLNCFRNGRFTGYTSAQGLFYDDISEILEDDYGFLWMSCWNGIFRIARKSFDDFDSGKIKSLACFSYGRAEGMASISCNYVAKPSAWKSRDGKLWFATTRGLAIISPNADREFSHKSPPVVIEEVMADQKKVSGVTYHVSGNLASGTIPISPGRGELEFHYTALSFRAPERNRFKYKLEGADSDWVDAGTRRVAYYNNLHPGRYQFHVIACNNDGDWNETGARIGLTLQPHYWQTWWFKFSLTVASLSVAAAGARSVTKRRMQRRLERLEQQHAVERERTRIARDMHDEIGARMTEILLLSDRGRRESEGGKDKGENYSAIGQVTHEMAGSLDALVWAVNPRHDSIDQTALYLCDYVSKFLEPTPIRCHLDVPQVLPAIALSSEARHNILMVVKEALNNVVKYAEASEVVFRVKAAGNFLTVTIKDNGKGFSKADVSSFGNGLQNMETRMVNVGGALEVSSESNIGTTVKLIVPLKG
jgi:ligand-binding sensor domain-containing protein/signal transduction histidine kinase